MRKWIPLVLTLGGFALSLAVYGQLPPSVAIDLRQLLPVALPGDTDLVPRTVAAFGLPCLDRKSTRLNSSHVTTSRMPSSA